MYCAFFSLLIVLVPSTLSILFIQAELNYQNFILTNNFVIVDKQSRQKSCVVVQPLLHT